MPTPEQVRTAIENHFRFWNAGDRAGWIRNFAENVVFHDPVGSPPKHGRSAAEKSWDNSLRKLYRASSRLVRPSTMK